MIQTIEQFYDYTTPDVVYEKKITFDEAIETVDSFCEEYND